MTESDVHDDVSPAPAALPRGRRIVRRIAVVLACLVALLLVVVGLASYHLVSQVGRIPDAFQGLTDRPAPTSDGTDLALVIDDTQASGSSGWLGGHGVALMLVRLAGDRRDVTATAYPLEAAVTIPGHGQMTASQAMASSAADTVAYVEQASGVRVDHLVSVGLDYVDYLALRLQGLQLADGWKSPEMIVNAFRAPTGTPVQRIALQEKYLSPLLDGSVHQEFKTHPLELWQALDGMTKRTRVDAGWSMWSMGKLVFSMRNLRSRSIAFGIAPVDCQTATRCTVVAARS